MSGTNGHGTLASSAADGVVTVATVADTAFKPNARHLEHLLAVQDVLASEERLTQAAIATRLKVTPAAVWKILQNERFVAWLNEQLGKGTANDWPKLERKFMNIALRGSVPHAEFLAKITGRFANPVNNTFNNFGQTDYTLIPRP